MYLSKEIRLRSKFFARNLVIFRFGACAAATLIVFAIPFLGSLAVALLQPDWDALLAAQDLRMAYGFAGTSLGASLGLFILNAPLLFGLFSWMSELTMGRSHGLSYLFRWCAPGSRFIKALGAAGVFVARALWEALKFCALPAAGMALLELTAESVGEGYAPLQLVLTLLFAVGLVYTLIRAFANFPALYLLAAVPEMTVRQAFFQCAEFMYDKKGEFFKLLLSFFPWYLAENFSYGLVGLFVKPYFYLSLLYFVQQIYNKWLYETGKVDRYVDPLTNLFEGGNADV